MGKAARRRTRRHRRRAKAQMRNPAAIRPHKRIAGRTGKIQERRSKAARKK